MASFHWAAQVGATKSFKLLLSHGADKTAKDINGRFVPWCEVKESKSIGKGFPYPYPYPDTVCTFNVV